MVKSGGTRRKIPMEKIARKESLATAFSKRSSGIYSKASQLCLLSGAQIAILATPPSSQSNVSFYSFGHSSVDAVVSAFLAGKRPVSVGEDTREEDIGVCLARKDLGLELWWEDERLVRSESPQELTDAIDSMARVLKNFKDLRSGDAVSSNNNKQRDNHQQLFSNDEEPKSDVGTKEPDQTLNLHSSSAICCIPDDLVVLDDDLPENLDRFVKNTEEQDQISDNNNSNALPAVNLDGCSNEEMDLDQLIDFETSFESLISDGFFEGRQELQESSGSLLVNSEATDDVSMDPNMCFDSDAFENGGVLVLQNRGLDEDDLRFSNVFSELTSIATLQRY